MDISIHPMGDCSSVGIESALKMLNGIQTIWKLKWSKKINKPLSYDPEQNLSGLPLPQGDGENIAFVIGITKGKVELGHKLSLFNKLERKALISIYEFHQSDVYDPPQVYWALALANICFRATFSCQCSEETCLGFKEYSIDKLLLKLFHLRICASCEQKVLERHKYLLPELRKLIDVMKCPMDYGTPPIVKKPDLDLLERQIRSQVNKGNTKIFDGYSIITVMHFLEDLIPFLDGLVALGAKKECMSLLVKPYPYSQKSEVHSYLYQNYQETRIEYLDEIPPPDGLLKEFVESCRAKSPLKKIIVIEDGGYLVPFLHRNYNKGENFCIGAVEQTTKGLRKDKELEELKKKTGEKLHFPILNVAKSHFKDEYEAPLVGDAVYFSIIKLLRDEIFAGKKALVVGFGAIGRHVADALRKNGVIVKVFDSEPERLVAAKIRGFETHDSPLELAKGTKLVIGTTGDQSIKREILENMENGTVLVSASSDQIEIDIEHLKRMCHSFQYIEGLGTKYRKKKGEGDDTYLLLADGFPINFYFASGIPNKAIDPILAQLFIGATYLALNHERLECEIIKNKMDDLIKEYGLLRDFLDTHGQ